ncbi:uncharacterized protein LOC126987542 isoform X2 [Eriocheir sinensis]|uniref:uncharacterized protein LOC126987542 isoform X2 n=1 Tax=Eriocheir sinensis TaxID=95602 RepID=UPI0021C746B7|nr:uncharacterized protein LOC126987542 isoform X2 [Eriocheir sinensis]
MDSPSTMRLLLLLVVCCALLVPPASARPPHRQKRVSDQRLAELETLLALAKMNRKYVTLPVGFGLIDVKQIGRRKRSVPAVEADQDLLPEVDEYDLGELLSALTSKTVNEDSGLMDTAYPAEELSVPQGVREGRQGERMKIAGARPAAPSPSLLYGLRSLPRRRYI